MDEGRTRTGDPRRTRRTWYVVKVVLDEYLPEVSPQRPCYGTYKSTLDDHAECDAHLPLVWIWRRCRKRDRVKAAMSRVWREASRDEEEGGRVYIR